MKQDAPLSSTDDTERDDDVEFLVPDSDCPTQRLIQLKKKMEDGKILTST